MFDWLPFGESSLENFNFLGTDMHAHWLPGLDDGAKDLNQSLEMLRRFESLGFTKLVATPHVMADFYPNSSSAILQKLEVVRSAATAAGINLELYAAAEYLLDEGFTKLLREGDLLTLPGNFLLVEFSFVAHPRNLDEVIFSAQSKGYRVIIAHPERYRYLHRKPEVLEALVRKGVQLQVNTLSLTDYYGKSIRKVAVDLINRGLVTFLGSDAHRVEHLDKLGAMHSKKISRMVRGRGWNNGKI